MSFHSAGCAVVRVLCCGWFVAVDAVGVALALSSRLCFNGGEGVGLAVPGLCDRFVLFGALPFKV
jgi:hypothetical protein